MKTISELPSLSGNRVLIRVDYNVPLKNNKIRDAKRIEASYKTIDAVLKKGGIPVLLAHLGDGAESLRPIATFLSKKYNIVFVTHDILDSKIKDILDQVPAKTIILLENIRRYKEEEKNSVSFAKKIASLGTYYINDAFSVSHRSHASIVGIPKILPSFAGFQLVKEITALESVLSNEKHPFLFILGGSKFSTKIPLISAFVNRADHIVITGAILNTFYMVGGQETGDSVIEKGYEKQIKPLLSHPRILLPGDVMVERSGKKIVVSVVDVMAKDVIVDIGNRSVAQIEDLVNRAKVIVWNGPTGWYEKGYTKATKKIATAIVNSKARAIIGGGDTGTVVESAIQDGNKKIFVSTGGGATLDFLAKGTLVGIDCL